MKIFPILILILFVSITTFGQTNDIVQTNAITNALHKANFGKIIFMPRNIPLDSLKPSDFLRTFTLARKSRLNIRTFMNNSVTNYLHQLAPELSSEKLLKSGNLQFSFFVDGKPINKENIHYGCNFGSGGSKNTSTTFRVPFYNCNNSKSV